MSPHTTSHLSVTPDDCLWSMKATLSRLLFASVASEEKKKTEKSPDSQEMKQTKVSASPPHMCLPDLQKEISNPPRTQCSERTEL